MLKTLVAAVFAAVMMVVAAPTVQAKTTPPGVVQPVKPPAVTNSGVTLPANSWRGFVVGRCDFRAKYYTDSPAIQGPTAPSYQHAHAVLRVRATDHTDQSVACAHSKIKLLYVNWTGDLVWGATCEMSVPTAPYCVIPFGWETINGNNYGPGEESWFEKGNIAIGFEVSIQSHNTDGSITTQTECDTVWGGC